MSLAALKTDDTIQNEKDSIGGGAGTVESGLYNSTVKMAYLGESTGGAMSLTLHLDTDGGEFRHTTYITSGKAKGQKNYYEKDGEKNYLPGFNVANSLCLLAAQKEISEMATEEKVVKIYDFTAKEEVPTTVPVLTELLGQPIIAGIIKQTVDKNKNVAAEGEPKNYQPTGETRDENEIDKFFRASDGLTTAEIRAGATESSFRDTWGTKNTGVTRMRAKGAKASAGGPAQTSGAFADAAAKPEKSIFG